MKNYSLFLISMSIYWVGFGLITIFIPGIMNLFHSEIGVNSISDFSNHIWKHGGFDILSFTIVIYFLSKENISKRLLLGVSVAALMPGIIIIYSLLFTSFWNPLFIGAGLGCFLFSFWGFKLSSEA